MDFKYKASVIVPVYNVEPFLKDCLDSLVNQTINLKDIEILLINDGSTDNSLSICYEYQKNYECIKVFTKDNEGLSATRNYGIKRATGKYLFFIDSDDLLTSETIEEVTNYFDTVKSQVDLVTYFEQPYDNDGDLPPHYRFKYYFIKQGVYDLNELPYITQTRINVCVKNLGEDNFLFDTTKGFKQEDQEYNNRVLMSKMKIGYCSKGAYLYNRANENSIVSTSFHAFYIFETSMAYFENLFSYFKDEVPAYFQAMFVNDIRWKLQSKILYPFHYQKEEFDKAINRILTLLKRVDNSTILNHPLMKKPHKFYWLALKENSGVTPYVDEKTIGLLADGNFVEKSASFDFRIVKFQLLKNNKILVRGHLRSNLFNFINESADIRVIENNKENNLIKVKTYKSKFGFVGTNVQTNNYYAIEYECDIEKVKRFHFVVNFDGFTLPVRISFVEQSGIVRRFGYRSIARGNAKLFFKNNQITVTKMSKEEIYNYEIKKTERYPASTRDLRIEVINYRQNNRIWLYFDLYTVKEDNGLYQFLHDFNINDGVQRYYVTEHEPEAFDNILNEQQKQRLVKFGSDQHKLLYLSAELLITAYYGRSTVSPFLTEKEEFYYYDIQHFRTVYLQHGVLHASLYVQNSCENARAEKIVISSNFEMENYTVNYNYREDELIPVGMPRYDRIDRSKAPKNKILFAPSWRNYLTQSITASKWSVTRTKIVGSDYYKKLSAFIESSRLQELLDKHDLHLELKLHPIIASATDLFEIKSERISLANSTVEITDYKMFITDFSSFVFDFACLNRPVMYFIPDYEQFKSGMGHYRDLDLPFAKAFGPLVLDVDSAINEFEKVCENNFVPEELYSNRMQNFYYPLENCSEKVYNYIVNEWFDKTE